MDAFTLAVATSLAAAIMAASLFALFRASPENLCLRDWSVAGLLFFVNSAIALAVFGRQVPYWLAPALINSLLVAAHLAFLVGLRRHLGHRPGWDGLALGTLAAFLLHGLPWLRESVEHRLLVLYPLLMAVNLAAVVVILRSPGRGLRSALTPLLVLLLLNILQNGLRWGLVLSGQAKGLTLMGSDFLQTSGQLALLLFILLLGMGCALPVISAQARSLREMAESDAMTGWRNRRGLLLTMRQVQAHSRRRQQAFALVLFDIDHFKRINDHHGHDVGDQAICHITRIVAEELRDYDSRFRLGGEEFLVLVPADGAEHVHAIAERLRQRVERSPFRELALTVSVGHARFRPADEDWEQTLKRADLALYAAKRSGRNRCLAHEDLGESQARAELSAAAR